MTKGLVRANNLADLSSKQDSIVNLGLAIADYDALRSLYATAGLDFSVIGGIAGSAGNYQAQIDGISSTLSGIVLSGFVNRQGNSSISTSWTNSDGIISISGVLSGYSPSSGTTFTLSIEQGEAVITTSGLSVNDLAYNSFRQANSTVVRASPPSGFNTLQLIPLQVGGQSFFVQASETPSFHIAPARMRHALDLVTGNLLGTYNSASPAMAVGPDGILYQPAANAPVIEYDPATGACLGARIWGAVTNLCLRSEELTDATWIASSSMSANTVIAPTGQLTAETLTGTGAVDFIYQIITVSPNTTYTGSVFVRLGTMPAANYRVAVYNQTAGSFIAADVVVAQTPTSSGWTRISYQFTTPSGCTSIRWYPFRNTSGVTGQTVHLFGPQVNSGPLGPYVPTTTLAASSTADVWTITGADFSRIWNQSAVTMYGEAFRDVVPAAEFPVLIDARTANGFEIVQHSYLTETLAGSFAKSNNVIQAELYPTGLSGIRTRRVAAAFAQDNFATCANGGTVLTDSSGTMPSPDRINLGSVSSGQFFNGYIRELAIFRSRRPNANLQAMTQ